MTTLAISFAIGTLLACWARIRGLTHLFEKAITLAEGSMKAHKETIEQISEVRDQIGEKLKEAGVPTADTPVPQS